MESRSDAALALPPPEKPPPESDGFDIIWMSGPLLTARPPPPSCLEDAGRFDFALETAAWAFATPLPQMKSFGARSCSGGYGRRSWKEKGSNN